MAKAKKGPDKLVTPKKELENFVPGAPKEWSDLTKATHAEANADKLPWDEPEEVPLPDSIGEMDEVCTDLWYKYFTPEKELSATDKRLLRDKYNEAAKHLNTLAGTTRVITITPSTVWVPTKGTEEKKPGLVTKILSTAAKDESAPSQGSKGKGKGTEGKGVKPALKVPVANASGSGKIEQILALHIAGKTNKEIVEAGFNKSTVNRQVGEYKKRQSNGK